MSAPVTPSELKQALSDPTATMCGNFVSTLIRFPILVYKLFNWLLDANGNPTKAFVNASQPSGSLIFSACQLSEDGTKLLCDGRQVSQTTYADLYGAILDTYANGRTPATGNFFLPDFRARFPIGIGATVGDDNDTLNITAGTPGGADKQSLAVGNLPSHSHFTVSSDRGDGSHLADATKAVAITNASGGSVSTDYWLQTAPTNPATVGESSSVGQDTPTPVPTVPPYLGTFIYIVT